MVVVTSIISWLIPDMPAILREQIRRENYITNEIILRTELQRAQGIDIDATYDASPADDRASSASYSPRRSEDGIPMEIRARPGKGAGDMKEEEKTEV